MKQHSKVKSSAYAPTTIDRTSQDILYSNMSNHYRLLLNAKKRVDTSPPKMHRAYGNRSKNHRTNANPEGVPNLEGLTPSDLLLIQQVAQSDIPLEQQTGYWEQMQVPPRQKKTCPGKEVCPGKTKCPVMLNCRAQRRHRSSSSKKTCFDDTTIKPTPSKQQKVKKDKIDRHFDCFLPGTRHFEPRILKTTASSKVRVSDSYHPPRRKEKPSKEMDSSDEYDLGEDEDFAEKWKNQQVIELVQCDGVNKPCPMKYNGQWVMEKSQSNQKAATCDPSSKVSTGSRDSAYNGGTSSGAESRGPTPEQVRRVPPIFGNCSTTDSNMVKRPKNAPGCPAACNVSPSPCINKMKPDATNLECSTANQPNGNDDVLYATFSHEITTEILKKGIYTDKGINAVINRHIELNNFNLALDKLQREADNIRTQLGIQNEEGVQKQITFAEKPQWKSEARRSISTELSDESVFKNIAKETEKKGSNNNLLCSSTSGKLDDIKSTSRMLEDANSVSSKLKDVYYSSSGKLIDNMGKSEDSIDCCDEQLEILKATSGINEYSSVSPVVSAPASTIDAVNVAHHFQLQVPKIPSGRSSSLPLPNVGGKQYADASSEVKPSTNSIETQTDITAM